MISAMDSPPPPESGLQQWAWHWPPPSRSKIHDFIHNFYQMLKLGPWDPEPAVMLHYPESSQECSREAWSISPSSNHWLALIA